MSQSGADLIKIERARQVHPLGWTPDHDLGHENELLDAARAYERATRYPEMYCDGHVPNLWPWANNLWRPTFNDDGIRNLVKAGALAAAAIDAITARQTSIAVAIADLRLRQAGKTVDVDL